MNGQRCADEGGEAPCFAHLLERPAELSDDLLARLIADLADAVIVADPDGVIRYWNDAAMRLFGWSSAEAIGRDLDIIIPARLRARHSSGYGRVMATGRTNYANRLLEVPALHRDGHQLSIAFTVTLLRRPGEALPIGVAAVLRDDTPRWEERRRLRDELARVQAHEGSAQ